MPSRLQTARKNVTRALHKWWQGRRVARRERTLRSVRDVATALGLVAGTLAILYLASGGAWPPMLVVESGSMMHDAESPPYGRLGTLDVGDVAFVHHVDPRTIHTWVEGGAWRYGRPGDVIAYHQDGSVDNITIVHRAIAWVQTNPIGVTAQRYTYDVQWVDGKTLHFGPEGIYIPALGIDETNGFTRTAGYRPSYSGYLTKGDNALTNAPVDQVARISQLVRPEWIEGRVYGELPWVGLLKLTFQWDNTNPTTGREIPQWERVGNGFAPVQLWTCLFLSLAALVLIPLTWDTVRLLRRNRQRRREENALAKLEADREEERRRKRAEERARRGPVEFQPVSR